MENLIIDIPYKRIDVIQDILDEKYWRWIGPRIRKTNHTYRNSVIGSDMFCNNCQNRHRCRTCRDDVTDSLGLTITDNELSKVIISKYNLPVEVVDNLIHSKNHRYKEYELIIPTVSEIKSKYKEFYDSISTVNLEYLDKFIDILSDADISVLSLDEYERYIYDRIGYEKINNKLHNQFQISIIPAYSSCNGRLNRILEYLRSLKSSMISNMPE